MNYEAGAPIILVGTQIDLRNDMATQQKLHKKRQTPINYFQGQALSDRVNAVTYVECSALTQASIKYIPYNFTRDVYNMQKVFVKLIAHRLIQNCRRE